MDCHDIEDLIPAYALDALEPEEALRVERHIEGCHWCSSQLRNYREVGVYLAQSVEQQPPPPETFKAIAKKVEPPFWKRKLGRRAWSPSAFAYVTAGVAVLLLSGVLAFTLRTSEKMDDLRDTNLALSDKVTRLQEENSSLSNELAEIKNDSSTVASQMSQISYGSSLVAERVEELAQGSNLIQAKMEERERGEGQVMEALRTQQLFMYMVALPGTKMLTLSATWPYRKVESTFMYNPSNNSGLFVATRLQEPGEGKGYRLWLTKEGSTALRSLGLLTVDEGGWGIVVFQADTPVESFDQIMVTEEPVGAGLRPTASQPMLWGRIDTASVIGQ